VAWTGSADAPLTARITALAPSLHPGERRVAEAIANDLGTAVERTAQEAAEAIGVGRATVVRTAQALGTREVRNRKAGIVLAAALFAGLLYAISRSRGFHVGGVAAGEPTSEGIGKLLLTDYAVPFEFASLLLLVAMVGAAYLVRRADS
jgi:DNA-binding MurR/RpiR family transcriptional regulator